ncbi:hypothetical protein [Hymenobacter properus]|uniref:Uncharacterized protein n=1 Tax=Hymenobacter properus TaxID=2791026 RepID=A0A931BJI6_9BACT|nr:hypothetical protein [Hymenobacter properus]MBF9140635.1 hypothetical protein [Hymenobacter properus]MBR7719443.1 hypothetical protein [Microvirga sp. SRT04]
MKTLPFKRTAGWVLAAGLAVQLASCVSTEREVSTSSVDPRTTYTPPAAGSRVRVGSKTVLNTVSTTHTFSDPNTQDNFILQLRGPRVLTAQAHLIVTSSKGDTLRHEVIPARALLSEKALSDPQASSVRDQEIAILQGMNAFFADAHFMQPAVPAGAEQPAEMDTNTWAALREDPTAVGFDYTGAGGAERRITYARKLRKAVVINQ